MPTIIYRNTSSKKINLPITGDEVAAGETISVSGPYPQPIIHPDLKDITNEEVISAKEDE